MKTPNVLLIEDDLVDQMNVKRAFKANKVASKLYIASNALDGLKMLRGEDPQTQIPSPRVVLLDINLPKMNGLEFLKALRGDPKLSSTSVFVLTTSNEDSDKYEAHKLNVAGYVVKPIQYSKFLDAIGKLNSFWQICENG